MKQTVVLAILLFASLPAFAQPGDDTFFVKVVGADGEPVRDAFVNNSPPTVGGDIKFFPTDGSNSTFAARQMLRAQMDINVVVSADGFIPVSTTIHTKCCGKTHIVTLLSDGKPRPQPLPLVTLRGRLSNTFGEPMLDYFRIEGQSPYMYYPKTNEKGEYSIKLTPGSYTIFFSPYDCTRYTLENYIIGTEDKTLDLTTECKTRRQQ